MELFFAQLFGIYMFIMGVAMFVRGQSLMPAVNDLLRNRALLLVLAVLELAAGLALVLAYPMVSFSLEGVLSLLGYVLVIEGIIYLAAPSRFIQMILRKFNRPFWYQVGGPAAAVLGAYLAAVGFGLF